MEAPLARWWRRDGRLTGIADPLGRSVAFTYDTSGNLIAATDVAGGVTAFTYDSTHLLLTMTDPRHGTTTNVYDSNGRVMKQTDALGRATTFAYTAPDANGNSSTTITDPKGNVTLEQYQNGLLLSQTKGYGTAQAATWSYTYDPVSLGLASIADPNGNVISKTWDANGNLLSTTDPLGRTTTNTYNSFNEVTSTTDPLGITTTSTYDANGNVLSQARPLLGTNQMQTTSSTYSDTAHPGDVTALTDPDGKTWHYSYDANGDRVSSTDFLGNTTTDSYNTIGWRMAEVSPNGNVTGSTPSQHTTSYSYDAFGDVTQVTDPLGHTTTTQYDANRNMIAVTDANGHTTHNVYDAENALTQVTRADGSILRYAYDANGNQTQQVDGLNQTTIYAYDALNRLASTTDPLGRKTQYTYDGAGNRIALTDPAGRTTNSVYDAANELIGTVYSDGQTPNVTYAYDADGRRVRMTDGTGTTSYTYDSLHRLTQSTNGVGTMVSYGYDLNGQLTSLTYPGGSTSQQVTRTYDAAGRLSTVTDWLGNTTRYSYDADGNLVTQTYPTHVVASFTYDAADRLTLVSDDVVPGCRPRCALPQRFLSSVGYTRNNGNLLTSANPNGVGTGTESYGYTALDQVSTVTATSSQSYHYDAGDNLAQIGASTLHYDKGDELTSLAQSSGTTNYTYDKQGNRTQRTAPGPQVASYQYDQANRLTGYTLGSTTAQYGYDGDGLRMRKTVGSTVTRYAWDSAEGLPLLLQDGVIRYVYGAGGAPVEQVNADGTVYYLHQDQLGSTRVMTNSSLAVVATYTYDAYTYDAYGNVTSHTGTASTALQFAGQYADTESGLLYLHARYYDLATGQFLTRDPLVPLTKQPYAYAGGDPLNVTDPSGKWAWFDQHADQISKWASRVSDVVSIVGYGCGLVELVICSVSADIIGEGLGLVSYYADVQSGASAVELAHDQLALASGAGELLIDAVGGGAVERLISIYLRTAHNGLKTGDAIGSLFDLVRSLQPLTHDAGPGTYRSGC